MGLQKTALFPLFPQCLTILLPFSFLLNHMLCCIFDICKVDWTPDFSEVSVPPTVSQSADFQDYALVITCLWSRQKKYCFCQFWAVYLTG